MQEYFKIGQIVKPQGVSGEIKVIPLTDDPKRFKNLANVILDNNVVKIISCKIGNNEVFLKLSGFTDRNAAESLRGKFLYIERCDAIILKTDSYFIADLIGCELIIDSENIFGKIIDVTENRTDYLTIKTEKNEIVRIPFLKKIFKEINVEKGILVIDKEKFDEAAVYED